MQTAVTATLREGLSIRLVAATCFVATKLVAFLDRGKGDYLESHDLEDVLAVVDGRPALVDEFERAVPISAITGEGIPALLAAIEHELYQELRPIKVRLPHDAGRLINLFHELGRVDGSSA